MLVKPTKYLLSIAEELHFNLMGNTLLKKNMSPTNQESFPFHQLPEVCRIKILSYLTANERGVVATVCKDWNMLLRLPSMWKTVDFTSLSACPSQGRCHRCDERCYAAYYDRVQKFYTYLKGIHPTVSELKFSFDIGDYEDGWLDVIQDFLVAARCNELRSASLNWKHTPNKPFRQESVTWSANDKSELTYRQKHRQRVFVRFFDLFTATAPNIQHLVLPFYWSERSVRALGRLQNLKSLVLEKYSIFQSLDQSLIDLLFQSLQNLEQLQMEVWTPSGNGLLLYKISSTSLRNFDMSPCRGFCLYEVNMPNIEVFIASRHPWSGPLSSTIGQAVPCLYDVMRHGMPRLKRLNNHHLREEWRDSPYDELEDILDTICSCSVHKPDTVILDECPKE